MDYRQINGVIVSFPGIIETPKGEVMKVLQKSDEMFAGFGEAYFSVVRRGMIKGLKRHSRMTGNLVVPVGKIRFVMKDDREGSPTAGFIQSVVLSGNDYKRLTIPPGVVYGFMGEEDRNLLLNISDIEHDPAESVSLPLDSGIIPIEAWSQIKTS